MWIGNWYTFDDCFLFVKLVTEAVFLFLLLLLMLMLLLLLYLARILAVHQLTGWNFKTTQTFRARLNLHIFIVDLFASVYPSFCIVSLCLSSFFCVFVHSFVCCISFSSVFFFLLVMLNTRKVIETCHTEHQIHSSTIHQIFYVPREMNTKQRPKKHTRIKKIKHKCTKQYQHRQQQQQQKRGAVWFGFL